MSGEERRAAILRAGLPLFAKQGFGKTTIKQLAKAAGVSEALLYKHFPSKEDLYEAIQSFGCQGAEAAVDKITRLKPSTSALVHLVYFLMRSLEMGRMKDPIGWETRHRLMVNSCLEDGAYPRFLFNHYFAGCFSRLMASLEAAAAAGDLVPTPVAAQNRCLFAHHLASLVALMHLPARPVIDYQMSREELLNQSVWFALRGMGLTDQALARHYHPKALATFFGWRPQGTGPRVNAERYEKESSS